MSLRIFFRDGLAKISQQSPGFIEKEIFLPKIVYPYDVTNNPQILFQNNICVALLGDLIRKPQLFVKELFKLRDNIGYSNYYLYVPEIGTPTSYALFIYLGIDLFDKTQLMRKSEKGLYMYPEGIFEQNLGCECEGCRKNDFFQHNYLQAIKEFEKIKYYIRKQRLRELVEMRSQATPEHVTYLRLIDKYYDVTEKFHSVAAKPINIVSEKSHHRVEVQRYLKRFKERYKKPQSLKILLLLPCAAKKPYLFSKSHKLFRKYIPNYFNVHEMIITSPLSLVPRELELYPVAQNYNISVTGDWSKDEIGNINKLLEEYLKNNKYEYIINHTGYEFIDVGTKTTINDITTSKESLENLNKYLEKIHISSNTREKYYFEWMQNFAIFQFGTYGENLLIGSKVVGNYPNMKIMNNNQVAMVTKDRGMLSLTLAGGEILARTKTYCVQIDKFQFIGNIFSQGIISADKNIRIGDDVVVLQDNVVVAVGVAKMSYIEMLEHNGGIAVKVRHCIYKKLMR